MFIIVYIENTKVYIATGGGDNCDWILQEKTKFYFLSFLLESKLLFFLFFTFFFT